MVWAQPVRSPPLSLRNLHETHSLTITPSDTLLARARDFHRRIYPRVLPLFGILRQAFLFDSDLVNYFHSIKTSLEISPTTPSENQCSHVIPPYSQAMSPFYLYHRVLPKKRPFLTSSVRSRKCALPRGPFLQSPQIPITSPELCDLSS